MTLRTMARVPWLLATACTSAPTPRAVSPSTPEDPDAGYYKRACGGGYRDPASRSAADGVPDSRPAPSDVREILHRMLEAHGGPDAWNRARALTFTHILTFGEPLAAEWFISEETTEIATRRTYQTWPLYGGELGFDGAEVWTRNWRIDNPPGVNVNAAYEVLAMPWLVQEADAVVEALPDAPMPGGGDPCYVVRARWAEQPDIRHFDLYIDRRTYLLAGVRFQIVHGGFLDAIGVPRDKPSLGPFVHVFYRHVRVGGLLLPAQYETFDPLGNNSGRHAVYGYRLEHDFDEARTKRPGDGVIDTTPSYR